MNITNANRKKALLLHYAGEEVHDMFSTLTLAAHVGEGDLDLYKQASDALNDYFIPKRNKERVDVDPSVCTLNGGNCGNDVIGIVFCNVFLLISLGHRRMGF
jgi:hypothetical protein